MELNDYVDKSSYFDNIKLPEGCLTKLDQDLLKKYATGKEFAVELGTFKGRGAIILSKYAKQVVTIDHYLKDNPAKYKDVKKTLSEYNNIRLIKGKSITCHRHFKDNSIDLLIQDAGHALIEVVNDVLSFLPKLKKNAIVMVHDYKYMDGQFADRDIQGGVKYLMLIKRLKQLEIAGWYWIGQKI
jgi:predicted O-methyltransferase YrrM